LLGAVVQVALEALALGHNRLRDPPPGREKLSFDAAPFGEIPDVSSEDRMAGVGNPSDRQLDREDGAVLAHAVDLNTAVEGPGFPRTNVLSQAPAMPVPQRGRDDELGQFAPDRLVPSIAEGCAGSRVELEDHPVSVGDDDRVK
jgi:hypothetical protein